MENSEERNHNLMIDSDSNFEEEKYSELDLMDANLLRLNLINSSSKNLKLVIEDHNES